MKPYQSLILIWVAVMAGHRFLISMWPGFLALCIRRTPVLWVKICVKKCVLYTRNYGNRPSLRQFGIWPDEKIVFMTGVRNSATVSGAVIRCSATSDLLSGAFFLFRECIACMTSAFVIFIGSVEVLVMLSISETLYFAAVCLVEVKLSSLPGVARFLK